jgi:hypothetical protein
MWSGMFILKPQQKSLREPTRTQRIDLTNVHQSIGA